MKKNLVIITFAHIVDKDSLFSPHQRFLQLLMTIRSAREKIPNSYIALLETGSAPAEYIEVLTKCVEEYHNMNVVKLNKNQGEATMLHKYLGSPDFQTKKHEFETVSKLSGRYFLTDSFDFNKFPMDKAVIKSRFFPNGVIHYETRYYRIPGNLIDTFYERFNDFMTNHFNVLDYDDVEHVFYTHGILKLEESTHEEKIGVAGQISGSAHYVED